MLTVQSPLIDRIGGQGSDAGNRDHRRGVAWSSELLAARAPPGDDARCACLHPDAPARIEFAEPLPLFVTFVTAWANRDGSVHFRRDTHGRDAKVAKLLQLD